MGVQGTFGGGSLSADAITLGPSTPLTDSCPSSLLILLAALAILALQDWALSDQLAHALVQAALSLTGRQVGDRSTTLQAIADFQKNLIEEMERSEEGKDEAEMQAAGLAKLNAQSYVSQDTESLGTSYPR